MISQLFPKDILLFVGGLVVRCSSFQQVAYQAGPKQTNKEHGERLGKEVSLYLLLQFAFNSL